ncbi:DgyrCDS4254 [Dimorphilus gyrociliatus]|uniref:DgyrCDS4254 n=1 Tax=Dimorphilus gyrociliatus TaxID=2664684 RepID=A0A7I8VHV6_9ANNE|nr:DgyrCDS4254 [Dimorphilus gyrociliatus]
MDPPKKSRKGYRQLKAVINENNPTADLLLAIGGATFSAENFSNMTKSSQLRYTFAKNLVAYARKYYFDGIDIDWEFPQEGEKDNFTGLLEDLRQEIDKEYGKSFDIVNGNLKKKLILSAAVTPSPYNVKYHKDIFFKYPLDSYDISALFRLLDQIHLMTYDLNHHEFISHHSRINTTEKDSSVTRQFAIELLLNEWLKYGNASKIFLGLPYYARTYTVKIPSIKSLDDPNLNVKIADIFGKNMSSGRGNPGLITKEQGILAYYEICELLKTKSDSQQKISEPYLYENLNVPFFTISRIKKNEGLNLQWIGYDDPESLAFKVNFAKSKGLGGVMIWAIDMDDFNGKSCGKLYPLSRSVYDAATGKNASEFLPNFHPAANSMIDQANKVLISFIFGIWFLTS